MACSSTAAGRVNQSPRGKRRRPFSERSGAKPNVRFRPIADVRVLGDTWPVTFAKLMIKWFSLVALIAFLVPPAWSIARDVLLLARADAGQSKEARYIIQRDIIRASSRALEARDAVRPEVPNVPGDGPTIMPVTPRRNLSSAIPLCSENDGTRTAHHRRMAVDEAFFLQFDKTISPSMLVMLNACLSATPFAHKCAKAATLRRSNVSEVKIIAELLDMGVLAKRPGGFCWYPPPAQAAP